jgi:hypothetical protein
MLRDYLCVLEADHAALGEDTEAVLAQARHVVARARRQRRERARRRQSLQPRAPLAPHPGQRGATSGTEPQSANGALNAVATPRQSESVRAKAQDARSSSAAGADGYPAGVSRSRESSTQIRRKCSVPSLLFTPPRSWGPTRLIAMAARPGNEAAALIRIGASRDFFAR